jgi:hypothetical protein
VRAHGAFERLKGWGGVEWATCVERFYDFERKFGFTEDGSQITKGRPEAVNRWLGRGRKWDSVMDVGEIRAQEQPDSYAGSWWTW